jgi:flagellar M-ring protein FliF
VGIVIPATLPPSEISKLTDVVSAALGLDASRGDKVDIAAIAPPEPVGSTAANADSSVATRLDAASTNASATDETASSAVVASKYWWIYPVIIALVLFLVGALLMAARTSTPRRLTMSEREAALLRLRQWIETTEVER